MCAPSLIASVRAEWSRRHFFGLVAAGSAAACGALSSAPEAPPATAPDGDRPAVRTPNGFSRVFDLAPAGP